MTEEVLVRREDSGSIATLTLDRPAQRNALSSALMTELAGHLEAIDADSSVHVVVLAGAGPAFCAGHDLREIVDHPEPAFRQGLFLQCSQLMLALTRLRQPVVAKVHGVATAAGCQLVATCDLALAGASARFATPGVDIGLFCSTPMVALTRAVSSKHAMELLLTGDLVDASTAERIGLVNRVVPDDQLDDAVAELAAKLASKSPLVMGIGKEAFWHQRDLPVDEAYVYASDVMATNLEAADAAEGIDAFLHKRPPTWTGN
ncbi:MAG TPA: enoyl-CoA hydratase [Acidimicrobiales bacterium]